MTDYDWAWVIIAGAAVVGGFGLWRLTRWLRPMWLRATLVALVMALFVIPAPIPSQLEFWAPALVVYLFEAFLQTSGSPGQSGRLLLLGLLSVLVLCLATAAILRFTRERLERAAED
ncbi:MAG: hypothetical protein AAF513_09790 [Pseudomonadota bacterium]